MVHNKIKQEIADQGLAPDFYDTVERCYQPLARQIFEASTKAEHFVLGIQGCQGSGKSTLASFLKIILEEQHQYSVAVVSIDDFYLDLKGRQILSQSVHPLLNTRGVPGTHDISLALKTLSELKALKAGESCTLPRFNKAEDEREPYKNWSRVKGPVNITILEGWCVAVDAQSADELQQPLNELEAQEDSGGSWRKYVNAQLTGDYKKLFSILDKLVVLNAPSFECVYKWRSLQEEKLAIKIQKEKLSGSKLLNPTQLKRFIDHYERLTRHAIASMPAKADWLLKLDDNHKITSLTPGSSNDQ